MNNASRTSAWLSTLCIALGLWGCSSTPAVSEPVREDSVRQERLLGEFLAPQLERHLDWSWDAQVEQFLDGVLQKLLQEDHQFGASRVKVIRERGAEWKNFSLPVDRLFLSGSLLSRLEHENEVAAVIAFELGLLQKRAVSRKIESGLWREEQGVLKLFDHSDEDLAGACTLAVRMLYGAGYDVRGMGSVWGLLSRSPRQSPYGPVTLSKLIEQTRKAVAEQSPLRNPVVSSEMFLRIKERIGRL